MKNLFFSALVAMEMALLLMSGPIFSQLPFTEGNVVVLRAGDGVSALSTASAPLFLDEFSTTGSTVQTVVIPTVGANRLTIVGNATTEGHITLSPDKNYLILPGYDAGPGVASIGTTTAADNNRKLLRVDYQVNFFPVLSGTAFSGTNIRSGVCYGDNYWASGSSGGITGTNGVQYFGTGTPAQVSSTITNIRDINIYNNQLYFSATIGTFGIYAVGTGLPTTGPQTATVVVPTGTGLPNAFSFNAAGDICYTADDRTTGLGGIQKYVYTGGTWVLNYTLSVGTSTGAKGMTVDWTGTNPVIYATTVGSPSSAPNKLVKIVDAGAASPFTVLSTAATNTQYRSVAFAPVIPPFAAPTVQAHDLSFTGITSSGITAGWTNGNGSKRIVIINTVNSFTDPANGTDPIANASYTGPGQQVVYNGNGSSVAVTGLSPSTTYWFRVYEYNGTGTASKFLVTTANLNPGSQATASSVPLTQNVQGITLGSGQSACYNATQTITVAGGGTSFMVQDGGSAEMIAGQNILYYPEMVVQSGGYLHGTVMPGGPFCNGALPSAPAAIGGEENTGMMPVSSGLRLYPNPTKGVFTLEHHTGGSGGKATLEVYNMHGQNVFTSLLTAADRQVFSLEGLPPGIYCIRIVDGEVVETARLIKQ